MALPIALVQQLEAALHNGTSSRRLELLQQVTSLFVSSAAAYNEEQTALFDTVLTRLVSHITSKAAAELSRRLAPLPNGPAQTIRHLAWSDDIDTAAPVLSLSKVLTDADLIEIARTKGQSHLAQIARRARLTEPLTDVIVDRGSPAVMQVVAANAGACFSMNGMTELISKAERDDTLAEIVGSRSDLAPEQFRLLLRKASEKARRKLLNSASVQERIAAHEVFNDVVADILQQATSLDYRAARQAVRAMGPNKVQLKTRMQEFATRQQLPELIVSFSELAAFPLELVESVIFDKNIVGALALCKAIDLDWQTARSVISAQPNKERVVSYNDAETMYAKMSPSSAHRTLRFWQSRGG